MSKSSSLSSRSSFSEGVSLGLLSLNFILCMISDMISDDKDFGYSIEEFDFLRMGIELFLETEMKGSFQYFLRKQH